MLTAYCFLSPWSSHLTSIPVKSTPSLHYLFATPYCYCSMAHWLKRIWFVWFQVWSYPLKPGGPTIWYSAGNGCPSTRIYRSPIVQQGAGKGPCDSSLNHDWLTTGHLMKPQATETAVRYVCNGCVIHGQHHLLFLSLPPTSSCFQLSDIQCSLNFKKDNVNLGMCSKLPFILTNLSSHESLYLLSFTTIRSFYD